MTASPRGRPDAAVAVRFSCVGRIRHVTCRKLGQTMLPVHKVMRFRVELALWGERSHPARCRV